VGVTAPGSFSVRLVSDVPRSAGASAPGELTLHEAADLLGVHYMTAYRYVRLGLLHASKAGASWRVTNGDLDEFRAGGGTAPVRAGRPAPWADPLEARLVAGDARGSWGVIEAALAAGAELAEVYLEVLTPALVGIGRRWEVGEIDIAVEHRATVIVNRLIGRLGPRFVRRGRSKGAIVVAAPQGERHALPTAILADLLRLAGWEVSDLGADMPPSSVAHVAAATPGLVAVGLSLTIAEHAPGCVATCAVVRAAVPAVPIVIGGLGVAGRDAAVALGGDSHVPDAAAMVRFLEALAAPAVAADA
jgi:excisionase family DNA binding protein